MPETNDDIAGAVADAQDAEDGILDLVGEVLPDLAGIPLPKTVKKSLWKSLGLLITGAADIGVAKLDEKADDIRAHGAARREVTIAAGREAASRFGQNPELGDRAVQHFASRIIREQKNREDITRIAVDELREEPPTEDSDAEIEEDWLNKFSEFAATTSNEEMKFYLGKILAGEICNPNSFSAASIQTLTTISYAVAKKFETLCSFSLGLPGLVAVVTAPYGRAEQNGLLELGVSYNDLCNLRVTGLLMPDLSSTFDFATLQAHPTFDFCGNKSLFQPLDENPPSLATEHVILFSNAGIELRRIISMNPNPAYIVKLQEWLRGNKNCELMFHNETGQLIAADDPNILSQFEISE